VRATFVLIRLAVRRDRIALPAWILGIAAVIVLAGSSVKDLYPTQADVEKFAATIGDNPALVAIRGRAGGLDTLGGAISWQLTYLAMILAALMSILLVVRHTRGDEETGRTELVLAGPVGRFAPLSATLIVIGLADVLVGALIACGLIVIGLSSSSAFVLGASVTAVGLFFAGVSAATAQLATTSRGASGLAGAILGLCYVVRGISDVAENWISWLSPIGWAQAARPYVDDRWWPLALVLARAFALFAGPVCSWPAATTTPV
jgi:ABC-2 type transport system permease protein